VISLGMDEAEELGLKGVIGLVGDLLSYLGWEKGEVALGRDA